jgi:hypothetical protein
VVRPARGYNFKKLPGLACKVYFVILNKKLGCLKSGQQISFIWAAKLLLWAATSLFFWAAKIFFLGSKF